MSVGMGLGLWQGRRASGGGGTQTSVWSQAASTGAGNGSTFSTTLATNDTVANATKNTDISTFSFPLNQSGKWFWQTKVIAVQTESRFGISSAASTEYIGNFGADGFTLGIRKDGTFVGTSGLPSQQTGVNIVNGDIVDTCVDLLTAQVWWSTNGTTWWGAGGGTTNTTAEVIAGTGGWDTTNDNRTRYPAVSGIPMGTMQLLAGTNITRSPPTGFTAIP